MSKENSILSKIDWEATPKEVFGEGKEVSGKYLCFIDLSDFRPNVKVILVKAGRVSFEIVSVYSNIPNSMIADAVYEELRLHPDQRHSWGGWFPVNREIREFIEKKIRGAVNSG